MCSGLLGLLLGHKFQPRYDYSPPVGIHPDFKDEVQVLFFVEHLVTRTYCGDICERCGIRSTESLREIRN